MEMQSRYKTMLWLDLLFSVWDLRWSLDPKLDLRSYWSCCGGSFVQVDSCWVATKDKQSSGESICPAWGRWEALQQDPTIRPKQTRGANWRTAGLLSLFYQSRYGLSPYGKGIIWITVWLLPKDVPHSSSQFTMTWKSTSTPSPCKNTNVNVFVKPLFTVDTVASMLRCYSTSSTYLQLNTFAFFFAQ